MKFKTINWKKHPDYPDIHQGLVGEQELFTINDISKKDIPNFRLQSANPKSNTFHYCTTLKFLGDINSTDIEKVSETIINTVTGHTPVSLAVKGTGVFPGIKRPRVIWVGLTGQIEKLAGMQKDIEENLEELGFPREKRPFRGHLTLGRIKGKIDPKKLMDTMKKFEKFESELFIADKIFLFKSDLKSTGSVYTELMGKRLSGKMVE